MSVDSAERKREGAPPAGRARNVLVVGKEARNLTPHVEKVGFRVVKEAKDAEFVICYGGDGSLLGADRDFPHLPKAAMRGNGEHIKCERHGDDVVLERIAEGRHTVTRLPRLVAEVAGHKLYGINDIVLHNARFTSAVRYRVKIDGQYYSDEIVGDGLVVATPFGSSAYYRSITNSVFRVGVGLAFNNSTESVNHLVLAPGSLIEVEVTRGPAQVLADNSTEHISVEQGDTIMMRLSSQQAEIWELETLLCKNCRFKGTGKPAGSRHV